MFLFICAFWPWKLRESSSRGVNTCDSFSLWKIHHYKSTRWEMRVHSGINEYKAEFPLFNTIAPIVSAERLVSNWVICSKIAELDLFCSVQIWQRKSNREKLKLDNKLFWHLNSHGVALLPELNRDTNKKSTDNLLSTKMINRLWIISLR